MSVSGDSRSEDDLLDVAEANLGSLRWSILASVDDVAGESVVVGNTDEVVGAIWAQEHYGIHISLQGSELIMDDDASENVVLVDLSASGLIGVVLGSEVLGGDTDDDGLLDRVVSLDNTLVLIADLILVVGAILVESCAVVVNVDTTCTVENGAVGPSIFCGVDVEVNGVSLQVL